MPYETFIRENIFQPLGMNHSTFCRTSEVPDFALPYDVNGRRLPLKSCTYHPMAPCGMISSNLEDMAKWLQYMKDDGGGLICKSSYEQLLSPRTIVPDTLAMKTEVDLAAYALGWIVKVYRGRKFFEHTGGGTGATTALGFTADRTCGYIILTNVCSDGLVNLAIKNCICDFLLDREDIDWGKRVLELQAQLQPSPSAAPAAMQGEKTC